MVGIGEHTVEINDPVGLCVNDSRVKGVASLVTCGVAFWLIENGSYDVAHKFFQFLLIIGFIALDIAIGMYNDAITVPRGLNQLSKRFGYSEILNIGGFEVRESVDPFCDGCALACVVGSNGVSKGIAAGCDYVGDQLLRSSNQR